jgi:HEAT repeat protein
MKSFFGRGAIVALLAAALAGCGNRETRDALNKADALEKQKQYEPADEVLVAAERAREAQVRAKLPTPTDAAGVDDLTKKVQADPEILKMERAQLPLYLRWGRPDLASAVYTDIIGGDPNDTSIYPLVKDGDPAVRTGAVRVLGLAGQASAIPTLAAAAKDANQDVRRAAVAALGSIKDAGTVQPLIDALKDSYWFVRMDAADALGRKGDARATKPLLDLVADSDTTVESSAENALVLLAADKAPADDFAARMNDSNPRIADIAVICLALEKDPRGMAPLLKLATSTNMAERLQAVKALGEAGDPAGIPVLRQSITDPDLNIRGWSIIGLGKLNDLGSVPALRAIAADPQQPSSIQQAANAAVNHITGTPPAATGTP